METKTEALEILGMITEMMKEMKKRRVKYFDHIKRHITLIKTILNGKMEDEEEVGSDTNWTITSQDEEIDKQQSGRECNQIKGQRVFKIDCSQNRHTGS